MNIERLRDLFDVDVEAGTLRRKVQAGNKAKASDAVGCQNSKGYLHLQVDRKFLLVHRVIFAIVNGHVPEQVDHINGNKLDNRPANLRAATHAENQRNARIRKANTSGVKGVSWLAPRSKWQARCKVNGRDHYLGIFSDLDAAAAAVKSFREHAHKEFARHG